MIHALPGLRSDNLMTCLASLGMMRVVSAADPTATCHWRGRALQLDTTVEDLPRLLVADYAPTPIVSPWNNGSGFAPQDANQRAALDRLAESDAPRLRHFRATVKIGHAVADRAREAGWKKERLVQELRNQVPDPALAWMDATVVITTDGLAFPSLLGSGGNDGRLDFSTNFHQRLADVLPELGAKPAQSLAWATDALSGLARTPLRKAAVGQFDPKVGGGPGSSFFGAADSLVNPWLFVLMLEGSLYFAASSVKRLGSAHSRASVPFTVLASPYGPSPGVRGEDSRGEVWAPMWSVPLEASELAHLFRAAKASWDGATASRSADMYAAVRSGGVDRRVDAFTRFAILQRNGLAFSAFSLDEVQTQPMEGIALVRDIEHRARSFTSQATSAIALATARYEEAHLAYVRDVTPQGLLTLLGSLARLEATVTRSGKGRERPTRASRLPAATPVLKFLEPLLAATPEWRLAASWASGSYTVAEGAGPLARRVPVGLRRFLVGDAPQGQDKDWHLPTVDGLGSRPLAGVLADVAVWRAQHPEEWAGAGVLLAERHRYVAPWPDLHWWVAGRLDDRLVEDALWAFMSLEWSWTPQSGPSDLAAIPVPALAVLSPFSNALVTKPFAVPGDEGDRIGLKPEWPPMLRAGRVAEVYAQAAALLSRSVVHPWTAARVRRHSVAEQAPDGTRTSPRTREALALPKKKHLPRQLPSLPPGDRLAAALLAPGSIQPLQRITHLTRSGDETTFHE